MHPGLEEGVFEKLLRKPQLPKSWPVLLQRNGGISRSFTVLLGKLLKFSPSARTQARNALSEVYFDRIRDLTELEQAEIGPSLFNFTDEELRGPIG